MGSFGGWLTPGGKPSGYDPRQRVKDFTTEHKRLGKLALDAYNSVDPFRCYYGEGCNPDEYLGYATKFVEMFRGTNVSVETMTTVRDSQTLYSLDFVQEIVRRTFSTGQVIKRWVTSEDIENIAKAMVNSGVKMSAEGRRKNSS